MSGATDSVGGKVIGSGFRVVEKAVKGMLPKNSLGRKTLSKLKVYAGPTHPHQAQKPQPYEIRQITQ